MKLRISRLFSRKTIQFALTLIFVGSVSLWGFGALLLSPIVAETSFRLPLALAYGVLSFATLIVVKRSRAVFGTWVVVTLLLLAAWSTITPQLDRKWQADVALLPKAEINGDVITIHNIRDFDYRSEFDFTPRWITKSFRLSEIKGVDVSTTYWAGKNIAHAIVSFEFEGDNFIAFSIETRKEEGESYTTLDGFFRQYELIYIAATERDLFGLRANYRQAPPEQVYLWRTKIKPQNAPKLFMQYVSKINELQERPEFYNTLLTNCTTQIFVHVRTFAPISPLHWQILLSGRLPELLDSLGALRDNDLPLQERLRLAHINPRSNPQLSEQDYSVQLRQPFRDHEQAVIREKGQASEPTSKLPD